jgi:hypothetical protein
MLNRSVMMTLVAGVLICCGVALGGQSTPAEARSVSAPEVSESIPGFTTLQLQPSVVDCRFVACASDEDCAITSGCSHNLCSNPATGQAFGRCTVRPQ